MNSRENNTLRMLRGIWKQGTDILNLLESDNSDDRYRGSLDGLRWISRTKVCFENLFITLSFTMILYLKFRKLKWVKSLYLHIL